MKTRKRRMRHVEKGRSIRESGQAIVEYIIIIAIVAVAALSVMAAFSTRIQEIISGVAGTFGADDASSEIKDPKNLLQDEFKDGDPLD
jgi:Flp pilus assembly pilin Flp